MNKKLIRTGLLLSRDSWLSMNGAAGKVGIHCWYLNGDLDQCLGFRAVREGSRWEHIVFLLCEVLISISSHDEPPGAKKQERPDAHSKRADRRFCPPQPSSS